MVSERVGHAARYNGVRYWLGLTGHTVAYYVRMRRWRALLRATWLVVGCGYYLEVCQECGRKVGVSWWADDDLYETVTHANGAGIFCIDCFDRLAEAAMGTFVRWAPLPYRSSGDV